MEHVGTKRSTLLGLLMLSKRKLFSSIQTLQVLCDASSARRAHKPLLQRVRVHFKSCKHLISSKTAWNLSDQRQKKPPKKALKYTFVRLKRNSGEGTVIYIKNMGLFFCYHDSVMRLVYKTAKIIKWTARGSFNSKSRNVQLQLWGGGGQCVLLKSMTNSSSDPAIFTFTATTTTSTRHIFVFTRCTSLESVTDPRQVSSTSSWRKAKRKSRYNYEVWGDDEKTTPREKKKRPDASIISRHAQSGWTPATRSIAKQKMHRYSYLARNRQPMTAAQRQSKSMKPKPERAHYT